MLKVIFMGVPEFAVRALERIHEKHQIIAVYTQPDRPVGRGLTLTPPPVKRRAIEFGLPVFQPEKVSKSDEIAKIRELNPDVIVVVAYGHILKRELLDVPKLGCINIHSSLLPRWRGAAPIQWALLAGDSSTGVTTMKMVEALDAGDIYDQVETPISPKETAQSLHDRLAILGGEMIVKTLERIEKGDMRSTPQDPSRVTYASKLTKEMELLSFMRPAIELDRQVRALNPWPGTRVVLESGEKLKIKEAQLAQNISPSLGELFERTGELYIGTTSGSLRVLAVQQDGKKAVSAAEFMNGLKSRGAKLPFQLKSEA